MENLGFVDALYMCFISATTVGYGDLSPQTPRGRLFACVWVAVATLSVGSALSTFTDLVVQRKREEALSKIRNKRMSGGELAAAAGTDGVMSESEFILLKLRQMQLVGDDELARLAARFRQLDADGSGEVDLGDLMAG